MNKPSFFDHIKKLTGHENRLSVERIYCEAMGRDLAGGMFVSELVFWCDKGKRDDGFFYRSAAEWEDRIYLSEYLVRKYAKKCVELGFLETMLVKANGAPTIHYRLDQDKFSEWILKFLRNQDSENFKNGNSNLSESITESTTESTTESDLQTTTTTGGHRRSRQTDPEYAIVCQRYEQEIGMLSPTIADNLADLLDDYGGTHRQICDAISVAVKANKRSLRFVEGILKNWRADGKDGNHAGNQRGYSGGNGAIGSQATRTRDQGQSRYGELPEEEANRIRELLARGKTTPTAPTRT